MPARVVLIRHGESATPWPKGWITRERFVKWRADYDLAGILDESRPPNALREIVKSATHVVASDLRRAMESARRLAPEREIASSPLLVEIPLPIPHFGGVLPFGTWGALVHLRWGARVMRGGDWGPETSARVAAAREWVCKFAQEDAAVCVVTHGAMRSALARDFTRAGWTMRSKMDGFRPWSAWALDR